MLFYVLFNFLLKMTNAHNNTRTHNLFHPNKLSYADFLRSLYKTLKSSEGSDSFVLGRHGSAPQLKRIPTGKNPFARGRPLLEPIDVAAALVDETSESQSAQRPQTVPARVRPRARRTSFVLREAPMKKMRSKKIVFQKDE